VAMRTAAKERANCDFCAIADGMNPAGTEEIAAGSAWVAFFPLKPATAGHTLVIPRQHVPDLWSIDRSTAHELMDGVIRVGRAIRAALKPDGMNLITSAGDAAEQTVYHLHMHIVPRWHGDGFGPIWPVESDVTPREERNAAARIRAAYDAELTA
jgi:histidine triad (HIT) family protein